MGVWVAKVFVSSHNPFSRKCRRKSRLYPAKSGSARVGRERGRLAFPRRDLSSRKVVVKAMSPGSADARERFPAEERGRAGALPYRRLGRAGAHPYRRTDARERIPTEERGRAGADPYRKRGRAGAASLPLKFRPNG